MRVIEIYDEIGRYGVTLGGVAEQLEGDVLVDIHSRGGEALESYAIYHTLREHRGDVTTRVIGVAAGGAAIVAQAGRRRLMERGGNLHIRSSWAAVEGGAEEMKLMANGLQKIDMHFANALVRRSSARISDVLEWMEGAGTWFGADRALKAGLVDEIYEADGAKL